MATLLKGKPVVEDMAANLKERIVALRLEGIEPCLAIVRVGERPDDLSYERTAIKRAEGLGITVKQFLLPADVSEDELRKTIEEVNADSNIHGCLLFRPLPAEIDEPTICNVMSASKDIDGITDESMLSVFVDDENGFPPSTAHACLEMLDFYEIPYESKHVVVIGRSLVVGKPVALMLLARNATPTICHSRTQNLAEICQTADIVICATGRARAFGAECFRPGQTVLDVGINFDEEGNLCGDVDFAEVEPIVDAITPVPGGIGTVTTSVTMMHVVEAAEAALNQRFRAIRNEDSWDLV